MFEYEIKTQTQKNKVKCKTSGISLWIFVDNKTVYFFFGRIGTWSMGIEIESHREKVDAKSAPGRPVIYGTKFEDHGKMLTGI